MKYRFAAKVQSAYPVKILCRMLEISRSGYYAWMGRKPSQREEANQRLIEHIRLIHRLSRKTYGSPRVHAELRKQGLRCNHKRVARLMRQENLVGQRKYRKVITTNSKHSYPVAPNLLNREFEAQKPNQKWVADITYIPTAEGWLYLAGVMDLYSRKIVGWEMSGEIKTDLVENALRMALYQRQPILRANRIQVSMSRKGDCYDNSVMESFFSTLKCEWVHFQKYESRAQARTDIFSYIEAFYNTVRIHSTLGYLSPNEFEAKSFLSP
jgi:putative transposase